ncbi:hypothetical protein ACFE04_022798 [Oxalis oulophora]
MGGNATYEDPCIEMETDVDKDLEPLPYPRSFKVHNSMCTELMKLVDCISNIFPEIEAARPGCTSGIQTLCLFNSAMEKAKNILQQCSEASKLYLAITGDVIVARCKRARSLLEQSLVQIQSMVPVTLAAKAGKVLRELMQQNALASDSVECSERQALRCAASSLHITSPKAIVIEKRSIKRLLDKITDSDPRKKKILKYLLYLVVTYGNSTTGQQENREEATFENSSPGSVSNFELGNGFLTRAIPPEEFKCPLSNRVMYDPVIVSSGQTFERMWIQKWFDEGNETCPKSEIKLAHRLCTPNSAMKDLISKWCINYGINLPEPNIQKDLYHPSEISSTSIASLGSSMNDLRFQTDTSNISFGYEYSPSSMAAPVPVQVVDIEEIDLKCLSGLVEIPWESRCDLVEDMKNRLRCGNQAMSFDNYVDPVMKFVTDARDCQDTRAQRSGFQLLSELVSTDSNGIQYFSKDTFSVLASFLDSETSEEALAIMEILSHNPFHFELSGALASILCFLSSEIRDYQVRSLQILQNLSFTRDFSSCIIPSEIVPKLVPFLTDTTIARHSLVVLRNMCDNEEALEFVAESKPCLSSVVNLLEIGSRGEQEHAGYILLSLCSQSTQFCQMVMDEGVIPALVSVSINGNEKGKVIARELLQLLRDIHFQPKNEQECIESDMDTSYDFPRNKKSSSKASSGFLGMKISMFAKQKSVAARQRY